MHRFFLLACAWAIWCTPAESKIFHFPADTFGFENQTYYDYKPLTETQTQISRRHGPPPDFSRHCFQMCRAVRQFFQFAEFRPDLPKVSEADYREIVRRVSRIPVWSAGPRAKVVVPGYPDLHSFSLGETLVIQKNLGLWWPAYWRVGNWRIVSITVRLAPVRGCSAASTRDAERASGRERPRRASRLPSAALVTMPLLLLAVGTRPLVSVRARAAPARCHRSPMPLAW